MIIQNELWTFRSQDHLLLAAKVPGVELSLRGTFPLWNIYPAQPITTGTFAPTDECSKE